MLLCMREVPCQIKQLPARECLLQRAPRLSRIGNAETAEGLELSVEVMLPPERYTPITLTWTACKNPQMDRTTILFE